MLRWRTIVAGVAIVAASAIPGPAAAAFGDEEPEAEPPSPALLIAGVVIAAGGSAVQFVSSQHYANDAGAGVGWLALSSVGGLTAEAGGALVALWGWRLGESRFALDRASGAPIKERRGMALAALAVGAAAFAATYVTEIYVFAKGLQCESGDIASGAAVPRCARDPIRTANLVQLASNAVLLAVVPVAGYGFGYDTAAKNTLQPHGFRYSLAFVPSARGPSAAALQLTVDF